MRFFLLTALVGLLLVNVASSLNKQRDCKCRAQASKRIIGGHQAANMSLPWQVSIQRKERNPLPDHLRKLVPDSIKIGYHSCGGTIVNERAILTSASCVWKIGTSAEWQVAYGDNDLVPIYNLKQYKPIAKFHQHLKYDRKLSHNDIALIELREPLKFGDSVQPACLGFDEKEHYEGNLKISGWGSIQQVFMDRDTGKRTEPVLSRMLKEAEVRDYSNNADWCRDPKNRICLKNESTLETICSNDAGGPVHYTKNGKSQVVGVGSTVYPKLEGSRYRVCAGGMSFTRLSAFKDWVVERIGQDYCS